MSTVTPTSPAPTHGAGGGRPRRRWWLFALLGGVVVVVLGAIGLFAWVIPQQQACRTAADPARSGAITEYCPSDPYQPFSGAMTFGPDGALWYTTNNNTKIARFSLASGAVTATAAPSEPNRVAYAGLVRGSDGNLWYIANNTLGRLRLNGQFTEYALSKELGFVGGIAAGPNGMLWVTTGNGALLKITIPSPSDATAVPKITQVTGLPANTGDPMAVAPDGSLWAATFEMRGNIALSTHFTRITPTGAITQLPLSIPSAVTALKTAPDGTLWFISTVGQGQIGWISPAGAITSYHVSQIGEMGSRSLAIGPDGNAWFATKESGVGRITPAGVVTTFALPQTGGQINNITAGPDGGVWFVQGFSQPGEPSSRIVRITP